jgi:glycosyltransferase involved in cell wall biosynthesis
MHPLRIALVTDTYPPEVNGVAMTNDRLRRGLEERGHRVLLLRPRRADRPRGEGGTLEVPSVPLPGYPGLRLGLPPLLRMHRALQGFQPDLLHIATEGPLGWGSLVWARRLRVPISSTFHTNFHRYCGDYGASFLQGVALGYLRSFHNRCQLTTVPDDPLRAELEAARFARTALLGRGVDTELFSPARRDESLRSQWGARPGDRVVLFVGRVAAEKNLPLFLEATRRAREVDSRVRAVVVGDGPVRRRLQQEWPGVVFAGMRRGEDLGRHYASADAFWFGSHSETYGNVVAEAMSSGLDVLTFDYAAGRQLIRDGVNGRLAPEGEESAFLEAARAWAEDPGDQGGRQRRARATAETMPWSGMLDRFEGLVRPLLPEPEPQFPPRPAWGDHPTG